VLQSGVRLPYSAINRSIAAALDIVVHLDRIDGRRVVDRVVRIKWDDALAPIQFCCRPV
jgi:hypothetical protein